MAGFTVTATNITDTTAVISVAADIILPEEDGNIVITVTSGGTQVTTQSVTPSGVVGDAVSATFTGLTASTGYTASFSSAAGDGETTFTTKATGFDEPRIATQEQWEDLVSRIKDKAEITTLTTADYNYTPSSSMQGIALWKLPSGMYVAGNENIRVYLTNTDSYWLNNLDGGFVLVKQAKDNSNNVGSVLLFTGEMLLGRGGLTTAGSYGEYRSGYHFSLGQAGDGQINAGSSHHPFVNYIGSWDGDSYWAGIYYKQNTGPTFIDYSTDIEGGTYWSEVPLATVTTLNGLIKTNAGAPTTSTVGTKGQLLEDTTNGKVYICTAVSGNTYTWTEVGSGSSVTKTSDLTNDGSDGTSTYVEADELASVATSGSYNDLSNKPTIPTVNDSTITITNNGTTVDSFTTNASSNKTIALSSPVITMTTTDPGEGTALAANHFIAVYN